MARLQPAGLGWRVPRQVGAWQSLHPQGFANPAGGARSLGAGCGRRSIGFWECAVAMVIRACVVQFLGHCRNSVALTFTVAFACGHVGDVFFAIAECASGTQMRQVCGLGLAPAGLLLVVGQGLEPRFVQHFFRCASNAPVQERGFCCRQVKFPVPVALAFNVRGGFWHVRSVGHADARMGSPCASMSSSWSANLKRG